MEDTAMVVYQVWFRKFRGKEIVGEQYLGEVKIDSTDQQKIHDALKDKVGLPPNGWLMKYQWVRDE